jgi:hypothetical protein
VTASCTTHTCSSSADRPFEEESPTAPNRTLHLTSRPRRFAPTVFKSPEHTLKLDRNSAQVSRNMQLPPMSAIHRALDGSDRGVKAAVARSQGLTAVFGGHAVLEALRTLREGDLRAFRQWLLRAILEVS